MFHLSV